MRFFEAWWPYVWGVVVAAVSTAASAHVVLHKRDSRAAVAWVGLIWLAPVVGALVYVMFGINRIRRRVHIRMAGRRRPTVGGVTLVPTEVLGRSLPSGAHHIPALARFVDALGRRSLKAGNRVTPLEDGPTAYAAMQEAIAGAQASVSLATYIFDHDPAGERFVGALAAAVRRGAQVRVLIDAVGARYSLPPIDKVLRRAGVRVARFLPAIIRSTYSNLRNHRKILVVDGRVGFTGGMNIRSGYLDGSIRDLHFRFEGPVVGQMQEVFAEDWAYTTNEVLEGERWFPRLEPAGGTFARGLTDGPDEDFENLRWALLGALAIARHSVRVVTPYFLPDAGLITALNVAAMRGVDVRILLPRKNNLALVGWASMAQLWQVLARGCRVFLSPPPFDHAKLFLVDGAWALVGSSNWDPRSFRLNFEFDVECYDPALVAQLDRLAQGRFAEARETTLREVDSRALPIRLRDGIARLFAPYL